MKKQKVFMANGENIQKAKVQSSKSWKRSSTDFKIFMADEKATGVYDWWRKNTIGDGGSTAP